MTIETTCCYTIEEIKRRNARAGFHFFDRDTMRFFRSRIAPGVLHAGNQNVYNIFITSEQYSSTAPRLYTVRHLTDDGDIVNLSEFQAFHSLESARAAVRRFAKTGEPFVS